MKRFRRPDLSRLLRQARPSADGRVRLRSRQIYILPTLRGLLFAALLAALLVAGINYGNNLVFALTFLLAGIGNAALLLTWRNLAGLQLALHSAEPVFAGATARFPAVLEPEGGARDAIRLRFHAQPPALGDASGDQPSSIEVPFRTAHRGVLEPGTMRVDTEFPLGLFRAWSIVDTKTRCLVYPVPVPGFPLPVGGQGARAKEDRSKAGANDFAGLREYQPGDSLNRISWKTSARTEDLHSKEFDAEADTVRWLDWDSVPLPDPEQRLGVLAAWVIEAATQGEPWGMRIPGTELEPASGPAHRDRCLGSLASFGTDR